MATSRSFLRFSKRLRLRANQVDKNVGKKIRRAALVADQSVVLGTPFNTGRAKANWITSVDTPLFEELETPSPGDKAGSEQSSLNQGANTIAGFRVPKNSAIFITNSLSYIEELDQGSSFQAPNGMTAEAIMLAQEEIQRGAVFEG